MLSGSSLLILQELDPWGEGKTYSEPGPVSVMPNYGAVAVRPSGVMALEEEGPGSSPRPNCLSFILVASGTLEKGSPQEHCSSSTSLICREWKEETPQAFLPLQAPPACY